ncbi:hypothetical protein PGT21_035820 [Puccinia graminis f. sp. tritici]|uniref:Uncharacterized protein n=1 Tax=Puccinia graminis f. sp. tritici TaxID=56615 RepID=A0A5B0MR89_PUCGR|nr:hypothetical protein PGT21_035820 [Puccinia graminis f. sp. tritici]
MPTIWDLMAPGLCKGSEKKAIRASVVARRPAPQHCSRLDCLISTNSATIVAHHPVRQLLSNISTPPTNSTLSLSGNPPFLLGSQLVNYPFHTINTQHISYPRFGRRATTSSSALQSPPTRRRLLHITQFVSFCPIFRLHPPTAHSVFPATHHSYLAPNSSTILSTRSNGTLNGTLTGIPIPAPPAPHSIPSTELSRPEHFNYPRFGRRTTTSSSVTSILLTSTTKPARHQCSRHCSNSHKLTRT